MPQGFYPTPDGLPPPVAGPTLLAPPIQNMNPVPPAPGPFMPPPPPTTTPVPMNGFGPQQTMLDPMGAGQQAIRNAPPPSRLASGVDPQLEVQRMRARATDAFNAALGAAQKAPIDTDFLSKLGKAAPYGLPGVAPVLFNKLIVGPPNTPLESGRPIDDQGNYIPRSQRGEQTQLQEAPPGEGEGGDPFYSQMLALMQQQGGGGGGVGDYGVGDAAGRLMGKMGEGAESFDRQAEFDSQMRNAVADQQMRIETQRAQQLDEVNRLHQDQLGHQQQLLDATLAESQRLSDQNVNPYRLFSGSGKAAMFFAAIGDAINAAMAGVNGQQYDNRFTNNLMKLAQEDADMQFRSLADKRAGLQQQSGLLQQRAGILGSRQMAAIENVRLKHEAALKYLDAFQMRLADPSEREKLFRMKNAIEQGIGRFDLDYRKAAQNEALQRAQAGAAARAAAAKQMWDRMIQLRKLQQDDAELAIKAGKAQGENTEGLLKQGQHSVSVGGKEYIFAPETFKPAVDSLQGLDKTTFALERLEKLRKSGDFKKGKTWAVSTATAGGGKIPGLGLPGYAAGQLFGDSDAMAEAETLRAEIIDGMRMSSHGGTYDEGYKRLMDEYMGGQTDITTASSAKLKEIRDSIDRQRKTVLNSATAVGKKEITRDGRVLVRATGRPDGFQSDDPTGGLDLERFAPRAR